MSSPLASAGVAGAMVLRPGMWQTNASRLWEWCAAAPMPAPMAVRTTIGQLTCPPNM